MAALSKANITENEGAGKHPLLYKKKHPLYTKYADFHSIGIFCIQGARSPQLGSPEKSKDVFLWIYGLYSWE